KRPAVMRNATKIRNDLIMRSILPPKAAKGVNRSRPSESGKLYPMRCPFCESVEDKVVDSRESKEGDAIRRRRECLKCGKRFTSYERIDQVPHLVVKKDGRRERFDRNKVIGGLMRACEKRSVSINAIEEMAAKVEQMVQESPDREAPTERIRGYTIERPRP